MIKKEIKFLLSHSAVYGLGMLVSQLVGFLMLPLYTRYLTPEDYGILEMITIVNSVLGILVSFSVTSAIVRFYYNNDDEIYRKSVISTSALLYLISACVAGIILFSSAEFISLLTFKTAHYSRHLTIAFAYLLLGGFNNIGDTYFRVQKKPGIFVAISLTRLILLVTLNIYFVVFAGTGIIGILYSTLLVRTLFSVVVMIPVLVNVGLRFNSSLARQVIRFTLPLIPSNIIRIAINQSDRFFITTLMSVAETGIFGLAVKIGNGVLILVAYPFNLAFMQRRFEIVREKDAGHTFTKVFTYFLFLMMVMGLGISVFIDELLLLMTTPDFYRAGVLVPLVVLYSVIFSFRFHFDFGILWSKKTEIELYINGVVLVVSVISNYLLIKNFGLMGAVCSKCFVTSFHTLVIYLVSNRLYRVHYEFRRVFMALSLSIFVFGLSRFVDTGSLAMDVSFKFLLMGGYLLSLCVFNLIEKDEIRYIKNIVSHYTHKLSFLGAK